MRLQRPARRCKYDSPYHSHKGNDPDDGVNIHVPIIVSIMIPRFCGRKSCPAGVTLPIFRHLR